MSDELIKVSKKVILMGNYGVGKTSLVKKFVHNMFSEQYITTIGVTMEKKVINTPKHMISMIIWDIAGEKNLMSVNQAYISGANGCILVCDLSRESSYKSLKSDLEIVRNKIGDIPLVVVGNKLDLVRESDLKNISPFIEGELFTMTSAKTGEMVEETFEEIAKRLV